MKIGIVGGGMTGLTLAYRLSKKGHCVTILEREQQLGGLATYHQYGSFVWDRFYHVILPSDSNLIDMLNEIGLNRQLRWSKTLTGFYVDSKLYSVSTALEFLRFPLVSLAGKIRLALMLLYSSRLQNWKRLEQITVEEWLIRTCGRSTYHKLWKPLLLAKLGPSYQRVSAVFIWAYVKRSFSARGNSPQREQLGHIAGGYKTVLDCLEKLILGYGGKIERGLTVRRIVPEDNSGLSIEHARGVDHFDKVVFTGPVSVLQRVGASGLIHFSGSGEGVEYLGVVCVVLLTRRPVVPFYLVNIADDRIPFTGIIGMSNLVSIEETGGLHLTYLPKYLLSDDPTWQRSDAELQKSFIEALCRMLPEFDPDKIEKAFVHRAAKVQPLQVLNYSTLVPECVTQHPDLFVLNTSQFVNGTLNNNEVIGQVNDFLRKHSDQFSESISFQERSELAEAVDA